MFARLEIVYFKTTPKGRQKACELVKEQTSA